MNKKLLVLVGVVLTILIVAALGAVFFVFKQVGPVTLTYWGLWEPDSIYQEVIAEYQRTHPNVTVKYQKMSQINYRERLTTAISREGGPDIMRIHNTWVPMMKASLLPIPAEVHTQESFKTTYYPVAASDLISGGQIWAVPLEIDTLVMYVNEDILSAGGVSVPTTWEEFGPAAARLTVRDEGGRIKTAGTAVGGTANIEHWQDILSLMTLQSTTQTNANVNQGNSQSAVEALQFYASFVSNDRVWDETLDNSTLAFANGKVAFYFGPSWRFFDIKEISSELNFRVYPVPQLTGGKTVNFASYWAEAISKKSAHPKEAAEFLKFLSSKETMTKLYTAEARLRGFGEPYSRVEMGALLASEPTASVVLSQATSAKSWYLASLTNDGDTGINSKVGKYYLDAVNSTNQGGDASEALSTVASGLTQVLGSYGL